MSQTVAIQYGIFTGKHVGKKMRAVLRENGYTVVNDPARADSIIAHSAGCFTIPSNNLQSLVLIDPPYWPEKSAQERVRARAKSHWRHRRQFTFAEWATRTWWGIYYAITDYSRNRQIIKAAPHYKLEATLHNRHAVIIRNEADDWLSPDVHVLAQKFPHVQVIEVPGDHDDCWAHPNAYVNALRLLEK